MCFKTQMYDSKYQHKVSKITRQYLTYIKVRTMICNGMELLDDQINTTSSKSKWSTWGQRLKQITSHYGNNELLHDKK